MGGKIKHKDNEYSMLGFLFRGTNIVRMLWTAPLYGIGIYLIKYGDGKDVKTSYGTLSQDMSILVILVLATVILPDLPKYFSSLAEVISAWKGTGLRKKDK